MLGNSNFGIITLTRNLRYELLDKSFSISVLHLINFLILCTLNQVDFTGIQAPIYSHDHPLSGWHVLPLEGDITCLRPEGALKSANCTTFTAAPKLGAFSVLPYSGVASKEACWFALTSYFRSKRDLLIVFLHRLTRERVDILY